MGPIDIVVIVLVSLAVLGVVGTIIYKKIKHKGGGCDCCGGCSSCDCCNKSEKDK